MKMVHLMGLKKTWSLKSQLQNLVDCDGLKIVADLLPAADSSIERVFVLDVVGPILFLFPLVETFLHVSFEKGETSL